MEPCRRLVASGISERGRRVGRGHDGVVTAWIRPRTPFSTQPVGGGAGSNPVHPNAILIFQQQADRDASGTLTTADNPKNIFEAAGATQYSWYPINLYDPREGFPRDAIPAGMANPACYVNGIMNAVELDVGNFRKWFWVPSPEEAVR